MMRCLSPAKINLYLEVVGKRTDGYHDLITLMQRIALYDVIELHPQSEGVTIECPQYTELATSHNLAYRAAQLILTQVGGDCGFRITIEKRIPVAAGLGGGSSNAATTLLAANKLLGEPLRRDELAQLGRQLGADVPFFIYERNAWGKGIGDELTEASTIPSFPILLVNPGFPLPTRLVYETLNLRLTKKSAQYNIPRLSDVQDIAELLRNDLERVAIDLHPVIGTIKDRLRALGALGVLMSGSGPTVFGIFPHEEALRAAQDHLAAQENWRTWATHTI